MTEYRFARPEEEADVLDLINAVFSQAVCPHDFASLIPKVYARPGFSALHALALENGRPAATVAMLPETLRMGNPSRTLELGFIGSVSVHPRYRSHGHMKALMKMQIDEARRRGLDFLVLGGQRQRYGYFGFECCGEQWRFSFNRANARHALPADTSFVFREFSGPEDPAVGAAAALHAALPSSCVRPRELFYDTLRTYHAETKVIWNSHTDSFAGYLTMLENSVRELCLVREADLPAVIASWLKDRPEFVISCPLWQRERVLALGAFAEGYDVEETFLVSVLNWERVLSAALAFRAEISPMPDGACILQVKDTGTWRLAVEGGSASVSPSAETPDLVLEEKEAIKALFTPFGLYACQNPLLRAWLPLPLSIPVPDHF